MVIQTNKIDTTSWGEFKIGDLFSTYLSKDDIQPKEIIEGKVPLISAGKENNGVIATINDPKAYLWPAMSLTVDMFGKVFYQPAPFHCVSHGRVNILISKTLISEYTLKFIASSIERISLYKYAFNELCTGTKLSNDIIKLPIDSNNHPDWNYMEQYMKAIEEKVEKTLNELEIAKDLENKKIDVTTWGEFRVGDLFELVRGKCSKTTGLLDGNIPYVGCTNINNGVMAFYDVEQNKISQGNCICFIGNGNGSAGEQIYRKEKFLCSSGNVCGYMNNLTPNIAHFIVSVMDAQQNATKEFSHANGRTLKKLSQQIIKLPIDVNGHPDWNYMEQYMKTIENKTEKLINDLKLLYN